MRMLVLASFAMLLSGFIEPHAKPDMPPTNCDTPQQHQFDFWIGDWVVTDSAGNQLGTSHVEPVLGGCALQEHWSGADGSTGTSLNAYIKIPKQWHQSWVAANGNLLLLDGNLVDGKMVLSGARGDGKGNTVWNRITWTPLANGGVRQTWDISTDGGKTWVKSFDGFYRRK